MRDCDRLGHFFPHEAATVTDNITTNHDLLGREGPTYVDVDWKTSWASYLNGSTVLREYLWQELDWTELS